MGTCARHPLALAGILLIIGGSPVAAQVSELAVERRLAAEPGLSVGGTLWIGPAVDSLTGFFETYVPAP